MMLSCVSLGSSVLNLQEQGVKTENILFLNLVCCPEGLRAMAERYPEISIITGAVDSHLNEHKYIVPGLGDYGDRYYGTS